MKSFEFLPGDGEMSKRIQAFDWSTTSVGQIESWPQSLKTTLSILLNAKSPMFLWWGDDLVQFYNDAYRPYFGQEGKHPLALGQKGEECWAEIWPVIKPLIDQVLETGEGIYSEDQLIPIQRNGNLEDVYWTFGYSAVRDESGAIKGVLVICSESTNKIQHINTLKESENLLSFAIDAAELATWDYNPLTNKFTSNQRLREWFGLPLDTQIDLNSALECIAEKDKERVTEAIQNALKFESGGVYDIEYSIVNPITNTERIVRAKGKAWFNDNKIAARLNGTLQDVTEHSISQKKIENSEIYFRGLTETVATIIWITDKDGYCTYLNKTWYDITGQTKGEAEGFGWLDATHPDDKDETSKLFLIANSGRLPFYATYRLKTKAGKYRWVVDSARPKYREDGTYDGMVGTVFDIHEQKTAENKSKKNEQLFRSLIEESSVATCLFTGPDMVIEIANDIMIDFWAKGKSVMGKPLVEAVPELKNQPFVEILNEVYKTGIPYSSKEAEASFLIDGEMKSFYYDFTYKPLFDENGEVYGIMDTAIDVTDKVLNDKKIKDSEQKLRSVVESAPFPIGVYVGKDMIIQVANQSILDTWGKGNDVIGKKYADLLPELKDEKIYDQLQEVLETGIPLHVKNKKLSLVINGELKPFFFNYSFTPLFDENQKVYGVMNTAADVTDLNIAKEKLEESEKKFKNLVLQAPVGIAILKRENSIAETVNDKFLQLIGRSRQEIENQPYWDVVNETASVYEPILKNVFESGIAYNGNEEKVSLIRNGIEETIYITFVFEPLKNEFGQIESVMVLAIDVTAQVISHKKVEDSERLFRALIAAAPVAIGLFVGRDLVIQTPNETFNKIVGKGDVTGWTLKEAMPELLTEGQPFLKILDDVYTTGIMFQTFGTQVKIVQNGIMTYNYYDFTYTPIFDSEGKVYAILDIAIDVTENVIAVKKIEESENNLRNTILKAPVAMSILKGSDHTVQIVNEKMLELWGKTQDQVSEKPLLEGLPEIIGQGFDLLLDGVFKTGETFTAYEVPAVLPRKNGNETVYVDFVYEAFREGDGTISGIIVVAMDVTQQLLSRKNIEQAEEKARLAIESADLGHYEVNLLTDEIVTSERFDEIWGLDHIAKRIEIASFIHPEDQELRRLSHEQSLLTGNLDYETRIIKNNNSIHWVKVKGTVMYDDNQNPKALIGVIQDITEQKLFAEELTRQVDERTEQLHRSNEDLLQFAHVASHDLKEPVRKIKIFIGMLISEYGNLLPERGLSYLNKVQNSTERMFSMIEGVLAYSTLNSSERTIDKINLNKIIDNITTDLEVLIEQKNGIIRKDNLPSIEGASVLIYQLFYNLINNALKFSKANEPVYITIESVVSENDNMVKIVISDTGIGLDPDYIYKIFEAFTRLNAKDEFEGTGLGLALCKKIVERHHGTLSATGVKNESATFIIELPLKQVNKII